MVRIAIAGAGFSGAYLARRLVTEGIARPREIRVFDPKNHPTKCGITPCAWGIHTPTLVKAVELCEIGEPEEYILEEFDRVLFGNVYAKADLCTFDKPKFIRACLEGIEVVREELSVNVSGGFDLIFDATASRALIGKGGEELYIHTRQVRVPRKDYPAETMKILSLPVDGIGYFWEFPLRDYVHVGFGVVGKDEPWPIPPEKLKAECGCRGRIRLSSPEYSKPIARFIAGRKFSGTVVAVGESAGMVSSVTGGGNKEAIDGIEILMEKWGDWQSYVRELCKAFRWADKEYEIVRKLYMGKKLGLLDYRIIKRNSERVGFKLGIFEVISLVNYILRRA
jgi:flavin-dependent dehydrogenase